MNPRPVAALAIATLALSGLLGARAPERYDLVIRNGRVMDGAGNPWIAADVAIRDGRFARIGLVEGKGAHEIDATGRYVAPGFIDIMDQSGTALLLNGLAENKLRMGVTTAIGGEGGTPSLDVPKGGDEARRAARTDEIPEYFATLERQGISINFGTFYSQAQARRAVIGLDRREPTAAELEEMNRHMEQAMRAGVLGMTTALIYPPSSYAGTDEIVEVARVAARHGGIYASHIRGEGAELLDAVHEAIAVGERAGIPVEIFHLKAAHEPGWGTLMAEAVKAIDAARGRGVEVAADVYPYTAGGTGLEATIPSWAHEGGADALFERLRDPATRARLKGELATGSPGWWNIVEASGGWHNVVLVNAQNTENAKFHGMNIAEIAKTLGKDPADTAWDFVLDGGGRRVMAIYHMMTEADVELAMRQVWTSIGSDAGAAVDSGAADLLGLPHPRSYGTFPRILSRYVRERGTLTLEDAIRKMTSWPATRMRLEGRGMIKEGLWADVVVFDFDRVRDLATYEEPTRYPEGIDHVIVNGVVVIDGERHTGTRPGRVLYGPGRP